MSAEKAEKIARLRALMRARDWDAVILTGSDPHGSEYPAERYKLIRELTGFTGEAADVVVTADHAGLWTDSRYFIQARRQLEGTGVELHKTRVPGQVLIPEWLASAFADSPETVLAVDGESIAFETVSQIRTALEEAGTSVLIADASDLATVIWSERPPIPQTPVFSVECGESRTDRIEMLRRRCAEAGADGILLSALDEIAWTLCVRGSDIEYNPYIISYLLVTSGECRWYVLKDGVEDPVTEQTLGTLDSEGIRIEAYADVTEGLPDFAGMKLLTDTSSLNYRLACAFAPAGVEMITAASPVRAAKAVKNAFEINGMRSAHVRDGVAMVRFLRWLERSLAADRRVSEWDAAVKLGEFRAEGEGYLGDSFETISAYGPGAALPHYVTPRSGAPLLEARGLYLCDSGGQYLDGTTDITRTISLGECTPLEREDYTLVLKGHIDLAMAVFPAGTPGCRIDALAREPLWRAHRDYGHGTGHGVGFLLGVHEGPQSLRQDLNPVPFEPGMIVSDEPGIYREGSHGVRHENLLLCVQDESNDFGSWLRFEPLTLCPFDTTAIDYDLLDRREREWLDAYHKKVWTELSPLLDEDTARWLERKCFA